MVIIYPWHNVFRNPPPLNHSIEKPNSCILGIFKTTKSMSSYACHLLSLFIVWVRSVSDVIKQVQYGGYGWHTYDTTWMTIIMAYFCSLHARKIMSTYNMIMLTCTLFYFNMQHNYVPCYFWHNSSCM